MSQTLQNTSAAEKMDGVYRRQRFIYDATRRYYLLGRDRLIAQLEIPKDGKLLEIGCGTARNLIRAAYHYPTAQLYGLDVSEAMLKTARKSIDRAGLDNRTKLAAGDARVFDAAGLFETPHFDRIMISYALSMIPLWQDVVRNALTCLAPGGSLIIVDFGDFQNYPALIRRAQYAWLRRFSVTPIAGFENEIKTLAEEAHYAARVEKLYGGYAILTRIERN